MLLQTFPYCRGHMVPQELWRFHQRRKEYPDSCPLPKKYDYFCYLKLTAFSLSRSGVEAISLPDPTQNYDNVEAVLTGWGRLSNNSVPASCRRSHWGRYLTKSAKTDIISSKTSWFAISLARDMPEFLSLKNGLNGTNVHKNM